MLTKFSYKDINS